MRNILGLHLKDRGLHSIIWDRFDSLFMGQVSAAFDSDRTNLKAYERRGMMVLGEKDQAYYKCLIEMAKESPEFQPLLEISQDRIKKKIHPPVSERSKHKIKVGLWLKLGNKIPLGELKEERVKLALKKNGYKFRRVKEGLGWYDGEARIGKSWREVLLNLDEFSWIDYV